MLNDEKIYTCFNFNVAFACKRLCAYWGLYDTEETADTEETTEVQTVTVDNPEYYTRFKNDGISINVYNWGEYIPDGSEEGVSTT